MWIEDADTDGDEAMARRLQREEEQHANQRADAAATSAIVPYRAAAAAAASSSSSSPTTRTPSSALTRDSPAIQILQRQVSELLAAGCGASVDIRALFALYNAALFDSALDAVHVEWSSRMKLCAGTCSFQPAARYCRIGLSSALLQYRPMSDVLDTLLHESIHALLFLGPDRCTDRDAHGPQFLAHMHRINALLHTRITVYHTFEEEVDLYRTHVWKCSGPCVARAPYFGLVKRSANRAPGPNDSWWDRHLAECGGSFEKIAAPAPSKEEAARLARKEERERKERMQRKIDAFVVQDATTTTGDQDAPAAAASTRTPAAAAAAASSRKSNTAAAASSSKPSLNSSGKKSAGSKRKTASAFASSSASAAPAAAAASSAPTPAADPHSTLAPIFRASPRKAPKPSSSAAVPPTAAAAAGVTSSAAAASSSSSSSSQKTSAAAPICLDDDDECDSEDLVDLTRDESPVVAAAAPVPVLKKPRIASEFVGNPAFTLVRAGSSAAAVSRPASTVSAVPPLAAVPAAASSSPAASSSAAASASAAASDLPRDRRAERARAVDLLAARAGRASPSVLAAPVSAS